ncbi:hypothetical protein BUALT_Bualt02G0153400 [Buddleja alternifolia]|uniref:Uncharacterized protein n=1 Tax=Buddleja alternifolia TaxID=168488 RepID=A0AAV6Y6N1_9LAMI|nr:hypothetical protein BUALT_Bualt02G0153400 [Buddleja alternifolia]
MSETDGHVQKQLEAPMPWIGIYIAAASLLCTLAMAADAFNGFRTKKFWFPSKFFSLSAASLTFLAIAMKLPVDLTTQMCDVTDRLAKLSSLVFLSTSMANFMTSLGSMANKDILMNVVALGVLVITVTVNVSIQLVECHPFGGSSDSDGYAVHDTIPVRFQLRVVDKIDSGHSDYWSNSWDDCPGFQMVHCHKQLEQTHRKCVHGRGILDSEDGGVETKLVVLQYWTSQEQKSPTVSCFDYVKRSKMMRSSSGNHKVVSEAITGKTQQPEDLLQLLRRSCNFSGVKEFDSHQILSLHSQDLPYCWSLPVATLTSIALALPNVDKQKSESLKKSVAEGLRYVKLVDKYLEKKEGLVDIRNAAEVVWIDVELYQKWQDNDLLEISLKGKSSMEILQKLGDKAEKTVLEFTRNVGDCLMKNPLNWPTNVIAAYSMYMISRTILPMAPHEENDKTGEKLFEQLSIMIADILAACLTNLAHVTTVKCHRIAIEK